MNDNSKQYVASISYGKDSLAMLHVITDVLHWPLTRIITADIWATDTIPADLPPMVEFKEKADRIIKERWGIEVEHFWAKSVRGEKGDKVSYEDCFYHVLSGGKHKDTYLGFPMVIGSWCKDLKLQAIKESKKTYESVFYRKFEKSKTERKNGQIYGFPLSMKGGGNWCTGELKTAALDEAKKSAKGAVSYIGIAADEGKRTEQHKKKAEKGLEALPLVEAGWTEQMCRDWCEENDLLSPIYTTATRGGCWFCHNQGIDQLRLLRKNYPDLWALLLKWDADSPVKFKPNGHTVHDYDRRFQWEDDGFKPQQKMFRWEDVDVAQMNLDQFEEIERKRE